MTTPDVRSERRAHFWLNVRNDSPIRVPPAQSLTESATRASARSRSRSRSRRVTRVSRVPNTNDSVRTSDAADSAWTNRSSSREWRSIEPEMSHSTTSERGSRIWPAPDPRTRAGRRSRGCAGTSPAAPAAGRASGARSGASAGARGAGTSRSTRRSASRSSAGVIRSNSRWRRTSPCEYASGEMTTPSIGASSSRARRRRPGSACRARRGPSRRARRRPRAARRPARLLVGRGRPRAAASTARSRLGSREPRRRHQRSKAAS